MKIEITIYEDRDERSSAPWAIAIEGDPEALLSDATQGSGPGGSFLTAEAVTRRAHACQAFYLELGHSVRISRVDY